MRACARCISAKTTPVTARFPPARGDDRLQAPSRANPSARSAIRSLGILEADVQAQARPAGVPSRRGARALGPRRNDQALEAAPAPAHAEQPHAVEHRVDRALRHRLQHDAEQSRCRRGSRASTARGRASAGQRRIEHLRTSGRARSQCAIASALAWCRASRTAACAGRAAQEAVVAATRVTPMSVHSRCSAGNVASLATIAPSSTSEWPPMYLVAACTDDVDAVVERAKAERRRPRVVERRRSAPRACATAAIAGMSCTSNVSEPGDSANTMRVFGRNACSIAGAEQRIVVARPRRRGAQVVVAEAARRAVDGVGDEHVVAGAGAARAAAASSP